MHLNKRGVALLQVLIVAAILAGMSALSLRVVLSRTLTARQNRHTVSAQLLIDSCMNELNQLWASKDPETYARDLEYCCTYGVNTAFDPAQPVRAENQRCKVMENMASTNVPGTRYRCHRDNAFGTGTTYTVNIEMRRDENNHCVASPWIYDGVTTL